MMPPGVLMPMQLQNYYTTAAIYYIKLAPSEMLRTCLLRWAPKGIEPHGAASVLCIDDSPTRNYVLRLHT